MFLIRGDRIWRHNLPARPVFDPILGAGFLLGFGIAVKRMKAQAVSGLMVIWTVVMTFPTLLAEDAPHFLRAVGILPVVTFLPALSVDWLLDHFSPRPWIAGIPLALLLTISLGSTVGAYFGEYAHASMAAYWFEEGAAVLAGRVNSFLGKGWDGQGYVSSDMTERWAYIDGSLWNEWPQARFLIGDPTERPVTVGLVPEGAPASVAVFVWPYEDQMREIMTLLPQPAEISVEDGPLSQGDRQSEPYLTYRAFYAARPVPASPPIARFDEGVELVDVARLDRTEERTTTEHPVQIRLQWRCKEPLAEDYTVFVHYLRNGERIAQADARPVDGHYPTTAWRRGDVINDVHSLYGVGDPLPEQDLIMCGLWLPESGRRLRLLDQAGNPIGDWIEIPVPR
jgi:hypothetical protein